MTQTAETGKVTYAFWKMPANSLPEFTSGGNGVSVIPGFGQWVLLHGAVRALPPDAILASKVVDFLNSSSPPQGQKG